MSDVEVEVTKWKDGLPCAARATTHVLRMGIGYPPEVSREHLVIATLRLAADVCTQTADKLEREGAGVFETHLKIPEGEW